MEALVFIDDSYLAVTESYIDEQKIEFIQSVGLGVYPDTTSGIVQMVNGILSVITSQYTGFISSTDTISIDAFDDNFETIYTTHISKLNIVQAERFINTTADTNFDNLVVLHFISGAALLTTIDFTQIPTLFPDLA